MRLRSPAPTVLLLVVTVAVAVNGALSLRGATWAAVRSSWWWLGGPIVIAVLAVAVVAEHSNPAAPVGRGRSHDGAWFLLSTALVLPLITLLGAGWAALLLHHAPWLILHDGWIPRPVLVVGALVLMDLANWLSHLAQHRVDGLWRVHALHHSQEEVNVLTTFRVHPLVHVVSFFAATVPVVALLGFHPITPLLITLYLVLGAVPHANVPWTFGSLGRVVCSPAYHRLHHAVDGPIDVNLGIVLPWWDMLAGRAVWPTPASARSTAVATGLAGRPVPVEQAGGATWAVIGAQLAEPFEAREPARV